MTTDMHTSERFPVETELDHRWSVAKALTDARGMLLQTLGQVDLAAAERIEGAIEEIDVAMEIIELRLHDIVSGRKHVVRIP